MHSPCFLCHSLIAVVFYCSTALSSHQVIRTEQMQSESWQLTKEGQGVVDDGSHEALVFNAVPADGVLQAELMVSIAVFIDQESVQCTMACFSFLYAIPLPGLEEEIYDFGCCYTYSRLPRSSGK